MKLGKTKLKQIVREELLKEYQSERLMTEYLRWVDATNDLSKAIKKDANDPKLLKTFDKYSKMNETALKKWLSVNFYGDERK
jgi:hypothetical protein